MKKRNPLVVFILSIVTFGIYDIYWLVKTKKVLNRETRVHTPTIWLIFIPPLVGTGLFIASFAIAVSEQHAVQSGETPANTPLGLTLIMGFLAWICWLFVVPATFYWIWKFSKAVGQYTNGRMGTGVTFLLLWLLHFIGVALVQDEFNDMIDAGQGPMNASQMGGSPVPMPNPGWQPPMIPSVPMPPQGTQPMYAPAPQPGFSPAPPMPEQPAMQPPAPSLFSAPQSSVGAFGNPIQPTQPAQPPEPVDPTRM